MYAALHDADADAPEFWSQDIGAMSRRLHQARVRDLHGWSQREILSSGEKTNISFANAVKRAAIFRRDMLEIASPKHIRRMPSRDFGEFRVGRQRGKALPNSRLSCRL